MQVSALIQVINYLREITGGPSLLNAYNKLSEILSEASAKPEQDFFSSINKEKEQLINVLLESEPAGWGYASYSLFDKINSNKLLGRPAADYIETLITPGSKDYNTIHTALGKKIKLLSKLSENLTVFQQLADHVVPQEVFKTVVADGKKSMVLLNFEGRLIVQNISDLERYSRLWDGIIGTFTWLTGEEDITLDIHSFSKNNIVLGVSAADKRLEAIMTGIVGIVASLPLILKIRKIQVDIAGLPLHNDFNELLEEEIITLINNSAWTTAQKLLSFCTIDSFDEDEVISYNSIALKQILSFIEKGGKIKFVYASSKKMESKSNEIMNESFSIARELESMMDLLAQAQIKKEELLNVAETEEKV